MRLAQKDGTPRGGRPNVVYIALFCDKVNYLSQESVETYPWWRLHLCLPHGAGSRYLANFDAILRLKSLLPVPFLNTLCRGQGHPVPGRQRRGSGLRPHPRGGAGTGAGDVRGAERPAVNDATFEDAVAVGLDQVTRVITTGDDSVARCSSAAPRSSCGPTSPPTRLRQGPGQLRDAQRGQTGGSSSKAHYLQVPTSCVSPWTRDWTWSRGGVRC